MLNVQGVGCRRILTAMLYFFSVLIAAESLVCFVKTELKGKGYKTVSEIGTVTPWHLQTESLSINSHSCTPVPKKCTEPLELLVNQTPNEK